MAKPIITTDTAGCRDVVDNGVNGFLCSARDHMDLSEKIIGFLSVPPHQQEQMGLASRAKAEAQYDERVVVAGYLAAIESATAGPNASQSHKLPLWR